MTAYEAFTKIDSDVPVNKLGYTMLIYRWDKQTNSNYFLLKVEDKQPLTSDYMTQKHPIVDTGEEKGTIYMVSIELYRASGSHWQKVANKPFIHMYTLEDIKLGRAYSKKPKKGNPYYYETMAKMRLI